MFDRDDVELALMALEEGWSTRAAGALVGASSASVSLWSRGMVPHERRRRGARGTVGASAEPEEAPLDDAERAAYEAAMTENMLLRAVLDDLKAAGSDLRSISNRRKTELGERLRAATGLPLREATAFLRISRSSYEYHRARLGRDKYAALRDEVEALFRSMGGLRGYRAVHAELRRRGRRVSEKVVRRLMRERGLTAARRRRRAWSSYAGEPSPAPPNLPLRGDGTHRFSAPAPNLLWVTDFPLFEYDEDEGRWTAMHHPFTCPKLEDVDKLLSDPGHTYARAYDIVLNGVELGGGSIRINDPEIQTKMFEAIGLTDEQAQERFGFLLNAFKYGVPPHGGMAYGLDRLVMLMLGKETIKDVIAFPKVQNASDLMTDCPSPIDQKDLDVLHIKVAE